MKKTKFIAIILAVATMLIGAGYASWDDVVSANFTVTTGNVDVDWHWNSVPKDELGIITTNSLGNANRSEDGNTYTVRLDNLYPGAEVKWTAQCINNGTLPVKFKDLDVKITSDNAKIKKYLEVYYDTRLYDGTNWSGYNIHNWMPFSQLETTMDADTVLGSYIVPTNGRIQFGDETDPDPNCIKFRIKDNAPESIMNQSIAFTLTFTFVQAY